MDGCAKVHRRNLEECATRSWHKQVDGWAMVHVCRLKVDGTRSVPTTMWMDGHVRKVEECVTRSLHKQIESSDFDIFCNICYDIQYYSV